MSRILRSVLCATLLLATAGGAAAQQKPRVAVLGFDDVAVQSSAAAVVGSGQDVGALMADLLVKELLAANAYTVIERRALDQLLKEQNFSNSSRADSKTAAAIGRLLGVQAIITGSVTQFTVQESAAAVGSGLLGRVTRGVIDGGKRVNTKAVVAMTARLVDTNTGEVLTAAAGSGESAKARVSGSGYASGVLDMTSSAFQETTLGEAVTRAVTQVATALNQYARQSPGARSDYAGLVADVSGDTIIINAGRSKGVQVGDTLEITRQGRAILDPQTKQVLRTMVDKVGTATITEMDDASATATVNGRAAVRVGDTVRRLP